MSLDEVKHIVLILSGKGGVGKSSVTTQLALSLNLAGKSVGILDVDLTGPSIPRLLGLEDAKITQVQGGWKPVQVHGAQSLPSLDESRVPAHIATGISDVSASSSNEDQVRVRDRAANSSAQSIGSLHAISLAFLLPDRSSAVIWRGPKKTAMVRQFLTDVLWPPLDYLLIDTPPGTSDEHISLAETLLSHTTSTGAQARLAGAIVITTPQAIAVSDVRKELNFCKKVGIDVLGVIENMSGYVCECCGELTNLFGKGGGEVMAKDFGVKFLSNVPVDQGWGRVVEEGAWAEYRPTPVRSPTETADDVDVDDDDDVPYTPPERSSALLVDRYRSCRLCNIFAGITTQVIDIVESNGSRAYDGNNTTKLP